MKSLILALVAAGILAGCSSQPTTDANYVMYLEAQKAFMMRAETPIMRMEALPGQTITLTGVKEFAVFSPGQAGKQGGFAAYQAPKSEWVEVVKAGLGLVGQVGSIMAVGKSVENLADSVGNAASHGYQYVQTPQPNMTIGGDGVIGSGTYSSLSGQGVIGAGQLTISTTLSGTGTQGSGAYTDSRSTPTTTTTDNSDNSNNAVTNTTP